MKIHHKKHIKSLSTIIIAILISISLWQFATAGWIQGKSIIAQQLLNHSWNKSLTDNDKVKHHRPWPWADTWPVAKLLVPEHNIEQIVLAGDSGNSLAFAPGHSLASAAPNTTGTTVISAHRDTHFSFLKDLKMGDNIYLQTSTKIINYKIHNIKVVDSNTYQVDIFDDKSILVLVTCYPFNSLTNNGSHRYLIYASPITI